MQCAAMQIVGVATANMNIDIALQIADSAIRRAIAAPPLHSAARFVSELTDYLTDLDLRGSVSGARKWMHI